MIQQNCDAAGRVLSQELVAELAQYVPGSESTQLHLQAEVWIHAPYHNEKFGSPQLMMWSFWAGLMTFRRWRQYNNLITKPQVLQSLLISRIHYIALELIVHAAINHSLCLFL